MTIQGKRVGIALTGSFCTYESVMPQIKGLVEAGADVTIIFSDVAKTLDTRFGQAEKFLREAGEVTGKKPITTIVDAEPIGPHELLDVLAILPCTGNTLAKIAGGVTDTPVIMAAKGHLRNDRPLVISISTNDALGLNLKNIGLLFSTKNIFFVPFGQDDPERKPNSMIAHVELVRPTIEAALEKKQYQPVVKSPF